MEFEHTKGISMRNLTSIVIFCIFFFCFILEVTYSTQLQIHTRIIHSGPLYRYFPVLISFNIITTSAVQDYNCISFQNRFITSAGINIFFCNQQNIFTNKSLLQSTIPNIMSLLELGSISISWLPIHFITSVPNFLV